MTQSHIDHLQARVFRAESAVQRHKGQPRSRAYQRALTRLYDARHALLAAELADG